MSARLIRVRDLKAVERQAPSKPGFEARNLFCRGTCRGLYSATPGDYFMRGDEYVFRCCGKPMDLITRRVVYTPVEIP